MFFYVRLPPDARNYTLYVRDDVDYDEETVSDKKCAVPATVAININSCMDETSSSIVLRRV